MTSAAPAIDDAARLTGSGRAFVASCLAEAGVCEPAEVLELADSLGPVMATTYRRTTLHLPDDDARTPGRPPRSRAARTPPRRGS